MGPIKSQADNVMRLFRSQRTAVHLVTVLEEMPVQETARRDRAAACRGGLPVGGVVVNMVRPQDLDAAALAAARERQDRRRPRWRPTSRRVGVRGRRRRWWTASSTEARDHAERRALEDYQRELVQALDVPTYELPRMPGGVDLGALYELAAALKQQGMA